MPQTQASIPSSVTSAPAIAGSDGPQPLPADILALLASLPGGSPSAPGGTASPSAAADASQSFSHFFPAPASASGVPGKLSDTMMPFRPGEQEPPAARSGEGAPAAGPSPESSRQDPRPQRTNVPAEAGPANPGTNPLEAKGTVQTAAARQAAAAAPGPKDAFSPSADTEEAAPVQVGAEGNPANPAAASSKGSQKFASIPAAAVAKAPRASVAAKTVPAPAPAAAAVAPPPQASAIQASLAAPADTVVQTNRWQAAAEPAQASFSAANDRDRAGAGSNPLPTAAADAKGGAGNAAIPASPVPQASRWQAAAGAFPASPSSPAGRNPKADMAKAAADDPPAGGGAKFAAVAAPGFQGVNLGQMGSERKSLPVAHQKDDYTPAKIGISSAPVASAMPAQTADRSSPATGPDLFRALPAQEGGSIVPAATAQEASPNVRAAQAVEAVVALVDAQTGRAQGATSAVKINFNINGDDLAVRIEVSNGAVRTQFHTDSPELRAALATQWQAAAPSVSGKALSFQQPTFSGTPGNSDSAPSADGGASRRQARPDAEAENPSWTPSGPKSATPRQPATAGTVPAPSSGGRLHAFA